MLEHPVTTDFGTAWRNFVSATRTLIDWKLTQPDRQYLQEFNSFRDGVLEMVSNRAFVANLEESWRRWSAADGMQRASELLLMELTCYPQVAQKALAVNWRSARREALRNKDALSIGRTIAGSVAALLPLSQAAQAAHELLRELFDLLIGE